MHDAAAGPKNPALVRMELLGFIAAEGAVRHST